MTKPKVIRDILYFDAERANSLLSQFHDGILMSSDHTKASEIIGEGSIEGGMPFAVKGKAKSQLKKGDEVVQHKLVHHEILAKLIDELSSFGLLYKPPTAIEEWRKDPDNTPYMLATGYVALDDFAHLREFTRSFAWLTDYLLTLGGEDDESVTEHQGRVLERLKKAYQALDDAGKNDKLSKLRSELREARAKAHEQFIDSGLGLPDWTLESIEKWISIFSASRLRMRMNIYHDVSFNIISDLDKDKFVDKSIDQTMASYGQRPNLKLTILCLATNVPTPNFTHPITSKVQEGTTATTDAMDEIQMEIDKTFESLIDVQKNMNGSKYPDIVVYPIAIFREFHFSK